MNNCFENHYISFILTLVLDMNLLSYDASFKFIETKFYFGNYFDDMPYDCGRSRGRSFYFWQKILSSGEAVMDLLLNVLNNCLENYSGLLQTYLGPWYKISINNFEQLFWISLWSPAWLPWSLIWFLLFYDAWFKIIETKFYFDHFYVLPYDFVRSSGRSI